MLSTVSPHPVRSTLPRCNYYSNRKFRKMACGCSDSTAPAVQGTNPGLALKPLNEVISTEGLVKYDVLLEDASVIEHNIDVVKSYSELDGLDKRSQRDLAFYCNAYNVWSIYLAYKKLEKSDGSWKGNVSFLDKAKFFYLSSIVVAGKKTNLFNLENQIIRKFGDPRIHCAINCASWSCPRLPQQFFEAQSLSAQFDERCRKFVNDEGGVLRKPDEPVSISAIFKWYKGDFQSSGGVLNFINKYIQGEMVPLDAPIAYQVYDWSINWTKNLRT